MLCLTLFKFCGAVGQRHSPSTQERGCGYRLVLIVGVGVEEDLDFGVASIVPMRLSWAAGRLWAMHTQGGLIIQKGY